MATPKTGGFISFHYHAEHHAESHLYTAWRPKYCQTHCSVGLVSEEDLAVYGVQGGNQQAAAPRRPHSVNFKHLIIIISLRLVHIKYLMRI